jgi:very-short-patch-repair endonuclease
MTIERSRPAWVGDNRSGLELQFERVIAAAGLPAAVREHHPFWCCEHPKAVHGQSRANRTCCTDCWDFHLDAFHFYWHGRNWRFDFAWPDRKLAVELEGAVYAGGRHTRGKGFEADCEKANAAVLAGWRILRFTAAHIDTGYALETLEAALAMRDLLVAAAATHPARSTRAQLSLLSGRSHRSSAFGPALRSVVDHGYLDEAGDGFLLTDRGLDEVGDARPPTGAEAASWWRNRLSGGELAFFDALLASSRALSREELAAATGRSLTSSAFGPALRDLVDRGLIERNGDRYRVVDSLVGVRV